MAESFVADRFLTASTPVGGGPVVWNHQQIAPTSHGDMEFSPEGNSTLVDAMSESYVTAVEDSPTQYLSVLDSTHEVSLENLNIALETSKLDGEEDEAALAEDDATLVNDEETNVVVFTLEGSDELYGIQVTQDEDGNVQKYQFQFRRNDEGQLEAIPESIQLLADEEEGEGAGDDQNAVEDSGVIEDNSENILEAHDQSPGLQIFVQEDNSNEQILPNDVYDQHFVAEEEQHSVMYEDENMEAEEDTVDIKPGILELANLKQEIQEANTEHINEEYVSESYEHDEEEEDHRAVNGFEDAVEEEDNNEEDNDDQQQGDYQTCLEISEISGETLEAPEENDLETGNVEEDSEEYQSADASSQSPRRFEPVDIKTQIHTESHFEDDANFEEERNLEEEHNFEEETNFEEERHLDEEHNFEEEHSFEGGHHFEEQPHFEAQEPPENNSNDSDNDGYQIVDGLHVTGDVDNNNREVEGCVEKISCFSKTNILKHALKGPPKEPKTRKEERLFLYFVHPEKENVDAASLNNAANTLYKPAKANPRSILKSSHPTVQSKNHNEAEYDEILSKRFARGKEAMQARIFHNFITKTTIPQAPVHTKRLPRKQKIKPVERQDEEIVVQEVMISSSGFVEATSGDKRTNLEVTEYVELTDSDDDYDPKKSASNKKNKKAGKHRKHNPWIEITISDSDDDGSGDSVIELDNSDQETRETETADVHRSQDDTSEDLNVTNNGLLKRRRGRPPKTPKPSTDDSITPEKLESPLKKMCLENADEKKAEIPCPKCTKTFPSQNSLKTHLQHHNLQSTMAKTRSEAKKAAVSDKYKCDKCGGSFKNGALLKRHPCPTQVKCAVCKKSFPDAKSLAVHNRIHVKQRLCKSTSALRVSPKKIKPAPKKSPPLFKPPQRPDHRCPNCLKVCLTQRALSIHQKSHNQFVCCSCSTGFPSKMLLEKHVRDHCVKTPKVARRSTPFRSLLTPKFVTKLLDGSDASPGDSVVSCQGCSKQFGTHKEYVRHKLAVHGLTPGKSGARGSRRALYKERTVHGGVPATKKLREAYLGMLSDLNFSDDDEDV